MTSLADLFNPTFLMFLGILVLVVALLVVYFESKMRDQNHKIASMLSLVSTLAQDMNDVKMGLNHLAISGGQIFQQTNIPNSGVNLGNLQKKNLIEVSDDEESEESEEELEEEEEEEEEEELEEEEEDLGSLEDDSDNNSEESNNDIKIVKLQVSDEDLQDNEYTSYEEESNNLEFEHEELDGDFETEVDNQYVEEVLDLKYEEKNLEESTIIFSSDLKTISINLEEEHQHNEDNIDYKKLQLSKLRTIVVEKGLTTNSEASKLKKPELLKLLGVE
jgi:hypothetical protein